MALSGFIFADKNVALSDLPTTITDFMKTYFPESTVDYAEYDDGKYEIWFSVEKDNNVVKAMNVNSNTNSYYVLKKNGNIYNYVIKQEGEIKCL